MASRNEQTSTVSLMLSVSSVNLNPCLENQPFCDSFRGRHSAKWKIWFQAILLHLTLQLSDDIRTVEFTYVHNSLHAILWRILFFMILCGSNLGVWGWVLLTISNNAFTWHKIAYTRNKLFRLERSKLKQGKCFACNSWGVLFSVTHNPHVI